MERKAYDQGQLNRTRTIPDPHVERVAPTFACPCGEGRMDWLCWNKDGTVVTCGKCNTDYDPCEA